MRLLPSHKDLGWAPYLWLLYLGFFLVQPVAMHAGRQTWLATWLGVLVFLVLYFAGYWMHGRQSLWIIAAIALLGVGFAPFNVGAAVFFVYAASFAAFAGNARFAAWVIAALLAAIALESLLLSLTPWFWGVAAGLSITVGFVNIQFAQKHQANRRLRMAQDEIEHLAKVAERERISRDLHDVLGHTLSLVVLKSELASKLIERDPQRAKKEISDIETISREALADVRKAIGGYRTEGLKEELSRAEAALRTAGVQIESEFAPMAMSGTQETVLALAVREAVTNVLRHSHARTCRLRLQPAGDALQLEIQDDGKGGSLIEGNGLKGMRERIEALHGTLKRDAGSGTKLTITLPRLKV